MTDAVPVHSKAKKAPAKVEAPAPSVEAEINHEDFIGKDHPVHGKWHGAGWAWGAADLEAPKLAEVGTPLNPIEQLAQAAGDQ
jgi:hypothetical protein